MLGIAVVRVYPTRDARETDLPMPRASIVSGVQQHRSFEVRRGVDRAKSVSSHFAPSL